MYIHFVVDICPENDGCPRLGNPTRLIVGVNKQYNGS